MRLLSRILLLIILLVCGCSKPAMENAEDTLSVSVPSSTKVYMSGLKTYWDKDDAVTVFYKTETAEKWLFKGNTGDVSGMLGHESVSRKETGEYIYVLYPYDADAVLEDNVIRTQIPSQQQYRKNSYGTALLASRSDFDFMTLEYCTAVVELKYSGSATISYIVLSANNGESISGESTISFAGGRPQLTCQGTSSVSLECNVTVKESQTTSFFFSIAPGTFLKGMTLMVHLKNGESRKVLVSEEVSIEAGHIYTVEGGSVGLPADQKVMHLLFSDGNARQNPFTNNITFTGGKEVGPFNYALDGKEYPFYMLHQVKNETTNFRITNGGGLYIGGAEGDYIKLPGLPDYRLQGIAISLNKESYFHVVSSDPPETMVEGGLCKDTQGGDFRILYLTGTEYGKSYSIMLDNNSCFRFITLYYSK